jgi:hypothetical protein
MSPSEDWNRQELLSVELKQPLDECKLQNFRRDEGDGASEEMTRSQQIPRQGLCRLKDDDWYGKKCERWIRPCPKSANSDIPMLFTRLASLRDDRDRREVTYAKNLPQLPGKLIRGNCG